MSSIMNNISDNSNRFVENNYFYKYGILSLEHLTTLQEDIDKLKRANVLSDNENFQNSMRKRKFAKPPDFQEAKYLIILARSRKLGLINFHYMGKKYEIKVPPDFHDDGFSNEDERKAIFKYIIKEPGYKIVETDDIHLKLTAVRSGLAKYGRNNISYIDGMGSFLTLSAYFTDYDFKNNSISEITMMDRCQSCNICMNKCPTKAIRKDHFVIDAGKCITEFNEHKGEFPEWLDKKFHNAIEGCLYCQLYCPENIEAKKDIVELEDITEEETKALLDGSEKSELLHSLIKKLKMFDIEDAKEELPKIKRNLEVLIK
ncbi:MAG: 4Fe-4S double cluster binding domain-containing protein [Candidatus Thorarchaeota archaeon]